MTTAQATNWFTSAKVSLIALILNVLCIVYFVVIKDNTTANKVEEHTQTFIEMKASIKDLNDNKADKITIELFFQGQKEIKQELQFNNQLLIKHITGVN